jgi:hypothetical protein
LTFGSGEADYAAEGFCIRIDAATEALSKKKRVGAENPDSEC